MVKRLRVLVILKGIMRVAGSKSAIMTKNLPLIYGRQNGYDMEVNQRSLINEINKGAEFFWNNPKKPWRKQIYEEMCNKKKVFNFGKGKDGESVSRQKEDIFGGKSMLRNMPMQSDDSIGSPSYSG